MEVMREALKLIQILLLLMPQVNNISYTKKGQKLFAFYNNMKQSRLVQFAEYHSPTEACNDLFSGGQRVLVHHYCWINCDLVVAT